MKYIILLTCALFLFGCKHYSCPVQQKCIKHWELDNIYGAPWTGAGIPFASEHTICYCPVDQVEDKE